MKLCTVEGCTRRHYGHGYCAMHYSRWKRLGDPLAGKTYNKRGTGGLINGGYHAVAHRMTHVQKAEKALGKPLPTKAVVHHIDYDKENNNNTNLVICPDQTYHALLHVRTDAYNACGNANFRRCIFCKQYDNPINMYKHVSAFAHRRCHTAQQKLHYTGK